MPVTFSTADQEVLVKVEGVSKKFCRSLKRSLWYGVCDIGAELNPFRRRVAEVEGHELRVTSQNQGAEGGSILPATSHPLPATSSGLRPGEFWAVNDVSFELRRGECLGLIGHNGAGKTTLLKMLNGLIKPDRGRIEMNGRVGALIALGAGFNPILTGRENIYINGSVLGLSKKEIDGKIDEIIDFAEIGEFIDMPVQNYSSGMQVRLGFAVATALDPDILILDEVLAVGDMHFQAKCLNTIGRMRQKGVAFILVTHNMLNVTRHCDRVAYMKRGRCEHLGITLEAVNRYERDMSVDEGAAASDGSHSEALAGSGKIVIDKVSVSDRKVAELPAIQAGGSLSLVITYRKTVVELLPVNVEIVFSDKQGELYRCCYPEVFSVGAVTCMSGRFVCHFDSIPANTDTCFFSVCLWRPGYTELYDWQRRIPVRVIQQRDTRGRLHLKSSIFHEPSIQAIKA
ncbi:MAG: ABC transporter ATP-binding protein [Candidatus Binatia bacterium]